MDGWTDGWHSSKHRHFQGPLTLCVTMPYPFHSHCVGTRAWALFSLSFSLWPWSQRQCDRPQTNEGIPPRSSSLLSFLFSLSPPPLALSPLPSHPLSCFLLSSWQKSSHTKDAFCEWSWRSWYLCGSWSSAFEGVWIRSHTCKGSIY